jgi:hypothetical protein
MEEQAQKETLQEGAGVEELGRVAGQLDGYDL